MRRDTLFSVPSSIVVSSSIVSGLFSGNLPCQPHSYPQDTQVPSTGIVVRLLLRPKTRLNQEPFPNRLAPTSISLDFAFDEERLQLCFCALFLMIQRTLQLYRVAGGLD
jgi:hypothetical protein